MPAGRKVNMVAGRGQASINFTSLGVGRHAKNIRKVVKQRVFINKPGCCDNPEEEEQVEEVEEEQEQEPQETGDRIAFHPIELNINMPGNVYTVIISLDKEIPDYGLDGTEGFVNIEFNDKFGIGFDIANPYTGRSSILFNSSNWNTRQFIWIVFMNDYQSMIANGLSTEDVLDVIVTTNSAYYNDFEPDFTVNVIPQSN